MKNKIWMASTFVLLASIAALFAFAISLEAEPVSAEDLDCSDPNGTGKSLFNYCYYNQESTPSCQTCYNECINSCQNLVPICDWNQWQEEMLCYLGCADERRAICGY